MSTGSPRSPDETVVALMTGAVPERSDEIRALWERYHPTVILAQDAKHITLNATKDRIKFDAKTMEVFWLIGFSGWRAIECYSPHVVVSAQFDRTIESVITDDGGLPRLSVHTKSGALLHNH